MTASLVWITPDAEQVVIDCARVSSPKAPGSEGAGLLAYLRRHRHWSPFEMASACLEISTTRDISRQLLRHRSFSFQEFSQRYAEVPELVTTREARGQHPTNRQASVPLDSGCRWWWHETQEKLARTASNLYAQAIDDGIAKECARALLPEGLTPTRMFMSGTLRSWVHFLDVRDADGVQPECRDVARACANILRAEAPLIFGGGHAAS